MLQTTNLNEFGDKVEDLFTHFFKSFKEWVEDFDDLANRRQKSADISPRFLDGKAKILLDSFDSLLKLLTTEYIEIVLEYHDLTLAEKKAETDIRLKKFIIQAKKDIQIMNVRTGLLLNDFLKTPFKPETEKRLKQIENFTYEDLVNKIHKSLEEEKET